ncbi:hypothetical protein C2845_PM13G11880 [Panicum miliaceum]|uniref:Uncharacterized protein n=1 Tax=Panicum miliaceum TaxID=4540 RepID=A0A3L6RL83_PANMI|nr:hypothetical protein C2845_PM13G11880 [Panicum miliaceum]
MATMEGLHILILLLILTQMISLTGSRPPPDPVACIDGISNCTITNAYASFPDRSAARPVLPTRAASRSSSRPWRPRCRSGVR